MILKLPLVDFLFFNSAVIAYIGLCKNDNINLLRIYFIDNPLFVTAFTTILLTESASEPILTISLLGLFIPTTTNITLLSNYIWSKVEASAEIKLSLISWLLLSEIFYTFIFLLLNTMLLICLIIENRSLQHYYLQYWLSLVHIQEIQ